MLRSTVSFLVDTYSGTCLSIIFQFAFSWPTCIPHHLRFACWVSQRDYSKMSAGMEQASNPYTSKKHQTSPAYYTQSDAPYIYTHLFTDINVIDKDGDTALHAAVEEDQVDIINILAKNNANPAILNHSSIAPIHYACEHGKIEVLKCLLTMPNLNLDIPGELGNTPLHYCCFNDQAECARLLVRYDLFVQKKSVIRCL